jgi:hypothetical protein
MDILEQFIKWINQPVRVSPSLPSLKSSVQSLDEIAREYKIGIDWQAEKSEGRVTHLAARKELLPEAIKLLQSEVLVYSAPIIKESKLERIVLCSSLKHEKHEIGGAMIADEGILYLDADSIRSWNPTRRAFHHEFFHCIDYHDDIWRYADPVWKKYNEKGFEYSVSKFKNRKDKFVHRLGFISTYSMTAVHEDKAELYSHMVINYNDVRERIKGDPILKEKFLHIRAILKRFCKEYDNSFWEQRSQASTSLPNDHAERLIIKISKEKVGGSDVWYLTRQDNPNATPLAFYSPETLTECFDRLGLCDFQEIEQLHNGKGELQLMARTPKQQLPDVWVKQA